MKSVHTLVLDEVDLLTSTSVSDYSINYTCRDMVQDRILLPVLISVKYDITVKVKDNVNYKEMYSVNK